MQNRRGGPEAAVGPPAGQIATAPGEETAGVGDPTEDALRRRGGRFMGGAGQSGADSDDGPASSAINAAVGEALTRMGGGIARDQSPYVDRERRRRDVLRLGISEFEADLLLQSGGL